MSVENAILETLAYSDIFDYPLGIEELHRYLVVSASVDRVAQCLAAMDGVASREGYYYLAGRDEIVDLRKTRAAASRVACKWAGFYGRILSSLPFVRMAALTGSLAVMNSSGVADMDYMLVAAPGRLWTARAFAVTFGRIIRPFGHTICVNLLVSENALAWPVRDLYSAREICQMIPITGMDVYRRLRAANSWTDSLLPNSRTAPALPLSETSSAGWADQLQRFLELPLRSGRGVRLEEWSRNYQLRRLARRFDEGGDASFSADVCQANFHNHRQRADENFHSRLASIGLVERADEFAEVI